MKKDDWKLYQRQKLLADWYGEDYAFTEMAAHTPEPCAIANELDAFWRRIAGESAGDIVAVREKWNDIVGEKLGKHSKAIKCDGAKLFVCVDHPAWQMELRRMKIMLCKRINAVTGKEKISDIVFVNKTVDA